MNLDDCFLDLKTFRFVFGLTFGIKKFRMVIDWLYVPCNEYTGRKFLGKVSILKV